MTCLIGTHRTCRLQQSWKVAFCADLWNEVCGYGKAVAPAATQRQLPILTCYYAPCQQAVRCTWESISAQPHALAPSPHTPPAPQRPHAQPRTAMQKQQEQSDLTRENTQRSRQSDNSAALITLDCNNLAIMSVTTDQVADYATATGRHVRMRLSGAGPLSSGSSCCTSPFVAPAAPLSEDSSPQPTISLRPAASAALPAVAPMPYASLRPGGSEHQLPMAVSQAGGQSTVPVLQQGVSEQMYRRTLRQAPRREDSMGTLTQRQGSYALIRRSALGALGSPLSPEASEVAANALRTSTWGLLHTRRRCDSGGWCRVSSA